MRGMMEAGGRAVTAVCTVRTDGTVVEHFSAGINPCLQIRWRRAMEQKVRHHVDHRPKEVELHVLEHQRRLWVDHLDQILIEDSRETREKTIHHDQNSAKVEVTVAAPGTSLLAQAHQHSDL